MAKSQFALQNQKEMRVLLDEMTQGKRKYSIVVRPEKKNQLINHFCENYGFAKEDVKVRYDSKNMELHFTW